MLFISSKVYNIRKFSSHRAPTAFFCHDHVLVTKSSDQSQVSSTRFRNWNTLKAVHLSRMSGEGMVDGSSWFDPFERDSDCLSFLNLFHSLFLSPLAGFFKYFFLSISSLLLITTYFFSRHPHFHVFIVHFYNLFSCVRCDVMNRCIVFG